MLQINNEAGLYVLDLNKAVGEEHIIPIKSVDKNGNNVSWGIEFISSDIISAHVNGVDELVIETPLEEILNDEYVVLRNYAKERLKINLKPNLEAIRPKEYKFKITKKTTNGRDVRIKIFSKETDYEIPWKCTYNGLPLGYDITPSSSDMSQYVDIKPRGEIFGKVKTIIKFTQEKSGNEIILRLLQSNDSVEILKAD